MALKRKRSSCSLSSPLSMSSTTSNGSIDGIFNFGFRQSSQSPGPAPIPFPQLLPHNTILSNPSPTVFSSATTGTYFPESGAGSGYADDAPKHLNSRTRKRCRDNRPDENIIHETTLQKLFAAQHHPHSPENAPVLSESCHINQQTSSRRRPLQSSLHAFWSLPQANPSTLSNACPLSSAAELRGFENSRCDDCDADLFPSGDMDMMMLDNGAAIATSEDFGCRACGKLVCATCAVLADVRICLQCAMSG